MINPKLVFAGGELLQEEDSHKEDSDHKQEGHESHDVDSGHESDDHDEGDHDEGDHDEGDHDHAGDHDHGHGHGHGDHGPAISAEDWTVQNSMDYYLSSDHLIGHVQDQTFFEVPSIISKHINEDGEEVTGYIKEANHINIPNPLGFTNENPMIWVGTPIKDENGEVVGVKENEYLGNVTFQPTKFIVLELFAALIVAAVFITLGRKMKSGEPVKGRFWNMLEAGCTYVRDEIARPSIGSKDADRFLPFLWTVFFFVLTMNLIGMVPGLGAATGSISITASLALVVFGLVLYTGMKKLGGVGFWKAQAPHIKIDGVLAPLQYVLVPMIWAIEVFGLFVKHLVLAVRLFANMFAGHLVLAVFVAFIGVTWNTALSWGVVPAVFGSALGINLLELLVAFIQAYVFTFLSALFIGAAIHPH